MLTAPTTGLSLHARAPTRAALVSPASSSKPSGPGFNVRAASSTHPRSAKYATEIQLEDLRVLHDNILGKVGGGFAIANDRLSRQRIPLCRGHSGGVTAAHEMAVEYAKIRETFERRSSRQGIQWMLVDNEIDIRTARWLVLDAAARAERGEPYRTESALAKLVAFRSQRPGGRPCHADPWWPGCGQGPAPRTLVSRDPHPAHRRGPSEVQKHVVARDILGAGLR